MFNAEALQELQAIIGAATAGRVDTDHGHFLVPKGYQIESLDEFMESPAHFKERFTTSHMDSFLAYVESYAGTEKLAIPCLVCQDQMRAVTTFDAGTPDAPGHRYHAAILSLKESPLFSAVKEINALNLSQRALAEFLEDWRTHLTAYHGDSKIDMAKVVTAIRIFATRGQSGADHKDESLSSGRSAFSEVEAKNKSDIPGFIVARGEPYNGLPPIEMPMRLSVHLSTSSDKPPTFALRMVRPDSLQEMIAKSFVDRLEVEMPDRHKVWIGSVLFGREGGA